MTPDDQQPIQTTSPTPPVAPLFRTFPVDLPDNSKKHIAVGIPWLIVLGLLLLIGWLSQHVSVSCKLSGELMTPLAQAEKSNAGIQPEEVSTPDTSHGISLQDEEKTVKKTEPLTGKASPEYGPDKTPTVKK